MTFSFVSSAVGGAMIGLAAALLLARTRRIAGISGIVGGLLTPSAERHQQAAFVGGMLLIGLVASLVVPEAFGAGLSVPLPLVAMGAMLVGIGTRMGSGCTSGHGVCGVARGSKRSMTSTVIFMGVAVATVYVTRHVIGVG